MVTSRIDEVSGLLIAEDPLAEAREILRLLDCGRTEELSALLAATAMKKRLERTSEVLEMDEAPLKNAV